MALLLAGAGPGGWAALARKRRPASLGFPIHHLVLLLAVGGKVSTDGRLSVIATDDEPCEEAAYWETWPRSLRRSLDRAQVYARPGTLFGCMVPTPGGGVLFASS